MTYDPNWFYSSVAQSAAALVGLLGAILAAKLQEQHNAAAASYDALAKLLLDLRNDILTQIVNIKNYAANVDERTLSIQEAITKGAQTITITRELQITGGGWSGTPGQVRPANNDELLKHVNLRVEADRILLALDTPSRLRTYSDAAAFGIQLTAVEALSPGMADRVSNWRHKLTTIEDADAKHRHDSSIRIPLIFVGVLSWLCLFGLVAPLSYLSAFDGPSKHSLLLAFSVGVLAIPIYIGFELARIYRLRNVSIDPSGA